MTVGFYFLESRLDHNDSLFGIRRGVDCQDQSEPGLPVYDCLFWACHDYPIGI